MEREPVPPRFIELDHTADVGVIVQGRTLAELFANAGYALFATIADLATVEEQVSYTVSAQGEDWASLMHEWLSRLLRFFTLHGYLLCRFDIQELVPYQIQAEVGGEPLDLDKHTFYTEIKGVTYHQLSVRQQGDGWESQIIFDV
ncbi:MAG: archease [Nitrospinota bacterium]|nr:MAG: archease [Nitrospinota bacterium]